MGHRSPPPTAPRLLNDSMIRRAKAEAKAPPERLQRPAVEIVGQRAGDEGKWRTQDRLGQTRLR
eukprot:CAMPEP_0184121444 /NCGR_PEP_ID=MMETSP0974-20121125/22976_1 /TAXON_ID=483370 /ORGANISM="non described non described, Strain CCMP2097" /LENGTH=63 /DNA_ID=CAMNT_0026424653 /DNA_START=42 /DNA_END=231 /DNA_ORIENTATION=+